MRDKTFPPFGGQMVLLTHRLRGHQIQWKHRLMLGHDPGNPRIQWSRPCRIYDCECGRAWVSYTGGRDD